MVLWWAVGACYLSHEREGAAVEPRSDAGPPRSRDAGRWSFDAAHDAGAAPFDAGPLARRECPHPRPVDLLVVLDDSGSMTSREPLLQVRLPEMLGNLFRPGDTDGDGIEDRPRVTDFHLGVVGTSVDVPRECSPTESGVLRRGAPADLDYCKPGPYPPFFRIGEGDDWHDMLVDFNCLAFARRESCQIEQPLEAMAHALLPRDAPFEYLTGDGRADVENRGFLRDDSMIAVLFITDEGDQSLLPDAVDHDAGVGGSMPDGGPRVSRSVARYLDVLEWLRPGRPHRVVLGMLLNIGVALADDLWNVGERICDPEGDHPGRLLDVARASPGPTAVGSLCRTGVPAFGRGFADRVAFGACMP
jgi:hypothetical protein